jgi:PAS domain S-box-containing protein
LDAAGKVTECAVAILDITKLQQSEEALKESEGRFRKIFENAATGIAITDWQGHFQQCNPAFCALLGYSEEELRQFDFRSLIHPEDQDKNSAQDILLESGDLPFFEIENRYVRKDGQPVWVRKFVSVLPSAKGGPMLRLALATDITARKQAEAALRESEERLRLAQESANVGIWDMYPKTGEDIWTPELYRIYGLTPGTIKTHQEWRQLVSPEDLARVEAERDEAMAKRQPFELEFRVFHSSGKVIWVNAKGGAIYDEAGEIVRVLGVNVDITARKQAEEALRQAHDELEQRVKERTSQLVAAYGQLDAYFTTSITPMVLLDKNFNFIRVNEAYARACQRPIDEFQGRNHFEFYPNPEVQAIFTQVVQSKEPYRVEARPFEFLDHPEWGVTYWDWTLMPVLDKAGEVDFLVFSLNDVTERHRAEEALRESEQRLRHLASQILTAQEKERKRIAMELHEGLGQSMTVLKLYLRTIQRHLSGDEAEITEDFDNARNLLNEMVEEVRHISRGLSPTLLENLGLTAAIKRLMDEMSKLKEVAVSMDIDDIQKLFSPQTEINLFRVSQEALNNIAKHAQASEISVSIKRQDGRVNFFIKDNGAGFDLEQIAHEDRVDKGMGIASMEERLRMIGSRLNIVSQTGRGTEVSFSIPCDANSRERNQ